MDILIALLLSFVLLLFSAIRGYFIAYPLFLVFGILSLTFFRRGFSLKSLIAMGFAGSRAALPVIKILLFISVVTAVWMASGTVPAIVYYGIQWINPHGFILAAFILTSLVSLLLGTSFGASSTIGIALMIMAKGSLVDPHIIAGAIIAGAYFGDRCSPMSSSAHLVATITKTNLYTNLKNMMITGFFPLIVTSLIYLVLSFLHPVQIAQSVLSTELRHLFNLHWIVLFPAIILFALAIVRVDVKLSMGISIAIGCTIALWIQNYSVVQLLGFVIAGFKINQETPIQAILFGGGMLAMAKVCVVVSISTAIAGILAGTNALQSVENWLKQVRSPSNIFLGTTLVGTAAAAFGCTQTIAILLTQQLVQRNYSNSYALALDLEDTVVVLAPLIPWNIAGLVPAAILQTDGGFIPYAFYLYLIPLLTFMRLRLSHERQLKPCR